MQRRKIDFILKNQFDLSAFYFQILECIYYESYRQVLTPVDNLQCLLRLPIFEKTRLVAFHLQRDKENYHNCVFTRKRKARVIMTFIHCLPLSMKMLSARCKLTTLSIDILKPLRESTSLSQFY